MADKLRLDIRTGPKGETYHRIVDSAVHFCDQALLIIHDGISLNPPGTQALKLLEPFLLRKLFRTTQWPGTLLHYSDLFPNNTATVFCFRLCTESAQILKDSVEGLYSWRQPEYPEDLCLLHPDGSPWMVSITHEEDSYFELIAQERDRLLKDVPDLDWVSHPPDPPGRRKGTRKWDRLTKNPAPNQN
ncbi:MAG: hypothetical protein ACREIJ_02340 [Nitrospiraceae bacterium]